MSDRSTRQDAIVVNALRPPRVSETALRFKMARLRPLRGLFEVSTEPFALSCYNLVLKSVSIITSATICRAPSSGAAARRMVNVFARLAALSPCSSSGNP